MVLLFFMLQHILYTRHFATTNTIRYLIHGDYFY